MKKYIKHCEEVKRICKTLFEDTGLSYYNYIRYDIEGNHTSLCSNKEWYTYVCNNIKRDDFLYLENGHEYPQKYILLDDNKDIDPNNTMEQASDFDIGHGLLIAYPNSNHFEFQFFGFPLYAKSTSEFYLNNLGLLDSYLYYFKCKAHKMIPRGTCVDKSLTVNNFWTDRATKKYNNLAFEMITGTQKFYIMDVMLTRREAECLYHLITAKNNQSIVDRLGITKSGYYKNIQKIKEKLGVHTTKQIINAVKGHANNIDIFFETSYL